MNLNHRHSRYTRTNTCVRILVLLPYSALEVTSAQVFYFRADVTSSAEMEVKTPPMKLLDKTIWNPHPEIDLASRAVSGESNSFRLFLGHKN